MSEDRAVLPRLSTREQIEDLFTAAVAQGMHAPFSLDCEYWGRQYADKLAETLEVDWESEAGHDRIREIAKVVRAADEAFEREGGSSRHWVRDHFIPLLEGADFQIVKVRGAL